MWKKFKSKVSYVARITMGISLLLIFITSIVFAFKEGYSATPDYQNMFTWILASLAMPGLMDYYAEEYNSKPKTMSYHGNCPKCRREVEMEFREIN